jgi:hypothetical protein
MRLIILAVLIGALVSAHASRSSFAVADSYDAPQHHTIGHRG